MAGTMVELLNQSGVISMHSETGIRSVAASSMLRRHKSVVLRLTERGYELTSEGEEPVVCESWPRAQRAGSWFAGHSSDP